jgi:hypothetical protein
MARGQEKVVIPREDLPELSKLSDGSYGYIVRYRIVSEDQNRFSHWSPIREIPIPTVYPVAGVVSSDGQTALVSWPQTEDWPTYDIFIKYDSEDFVYSGTSVDNSYSFIIDSEKIEVTVKIQVGSSLKELDSAIEIYDSGVLNLVQLRGTSLSILF